MLIPTKTALDEWLSVMLADTPGLGSGSIGLIANNLTPSESTTLAQIVEPTYSGYTRQATGSWSGIFTDPNGLETAEGSALRFMASDTTSTTIFGLFITGHPSTTLLGCEMFTQPIPIIGGQTQLTIIPRVGLDPNGRWGFSVVAP